MSDERNDLRRHPRFVVDVEATVALPDGQRLVARTRDVSRNGVCLVTSAALRPGDDVDVELVLAFGENAFSEPLCLVARVVWCTPIGDAYQIGGMFDDISDEQDGYLDLFLQFLDGTLSPKGVSEDDEDDPAGRRDDDDPFRS